jgi:hypothetical protein
MPEPATDGTQSSSSTDGSQPASLQECPAWAEWPMPSPPSLTGVPGDPQRNLPNPQSYDTSDANVVIDNVTHLVWQKTASTETLAWADAAAFCANLDLDGRDDWRLPARIELASLIDFTESRSGNISNSAFPDPLAEQFWACSPGPANPLVAWVTDFSNGSSGISDKTASHAVRCVAGTPIATAPPVRYDLTTSGEVRDLGTLLVWATAVPDLVDWGQAYQYCANLGTGWRLPTLTELQTLIDETQAVAAVDRTAFPDSPDEYYWTSSFSDNSLDMPWFTSIGAGNTWWVPTSEMHRARCVR